MISMRRPLRRAILGNDLFGHLHAGREGGQRRDDANGDLLLQARAVQAGHQDEHGGADRPVAQVHDRSHARNVNRRRRDRLDQFDRRLRSSRHERCHDAPRTTLRRPPYPLGADDYEPSAPRVDGQKRRSWGSVGKIIRRAGGILAVALVFSLLGILARGFAPHEIGICTASLS